MSAADIREGLCTSCGQELLLDIISGDCWHPYTVTDPCLPTRFMIGDEVFYSNRPDRKYWVDPDAVPLPNTRAINPHCDHRSPMSYPCRPKTVDAAEFCYAHPSHDWPCPHASANSAATTAPG